MEKEMPELLAPAGSMNAFKAALNAGADAIYLAGESFGARFYANNFSKEEIIEAVDIAHLNRVKVYVTVNTLIKDRELEKISKYLIFLYEVGVDAILVQDMGVASISKRIVPGLNLHASTQMTVQNIEGIRWAADTGFKRVVLPREMGFQEINETVKKTKSQIELEMFVHGALCYSYSGQCLMSSFIGGRSGNRGMCAQPCRKEYELVFGKKDEYGKPSKLNAIPLKDRYLLSTRDLCLYKHLDQITKLNLSSIKIEGRMRSPEYVAIVVRIYRKALDSIQKGKWKPSKEDMVKLKLAFNRDFTGGYAFAQDYNEIMGENRPGHRGVYVGSVHKYDKKTGNALIKADSKFLPQKGDGVVFKSPHGHHVDQGMFIDTSPSFKKDKFKINVRNPLSPGSKLFLTRSKSLLGDAQRIIKKSDSFKNKVPVDLSIQIDADGFINLKSVFNGSNGSLILEMISDFKMEKAINKPVTKETILKQFLKTGGSPFIFDSINIDYFEDLFTPISLLNRLRRDLFAKIKETIIQSYKPSPDKIDRSHLKESALFNDVSSNQPPLKRKTLKMDAYVDNLDVLKVAVENGCEKIYFNPFNTYSTVKCDYKNKIDVDKISNQIIKASSMCKINEVDFILKLPKINSSQFLYDIKPVLMEAFAAGINQFMVSNMGSLRFILNLNSDVYFFASPSLNIWNFESLNTVKNCFKGIIVSLEVSKEELSDFTSKISRRGIDVELGIIVQGNMESLISKNCLPCKLDDAFWEGDDFNNLFLGIRDNKKHVFPIRLDFECRTLILNSVELSLLDYISGISQMGLDDIVLDFEGRSIEYSRLICCIYRDLILMDVNAPGYRNEFLKMKNKVKKVSLGGITTGSFIRKTS